jgi:hypothetical protein
MDPPFKSTESSPIQFVNPSPGCATAAKKEKAANDLQTVGIASLHPSYGFAYGLLNSKHEATTGESWKARAREEKEAFGPKPLE